MLYACTYYYLALTVTQFEELMNCLKDTNASVTSLTLHPEGELPYYIFQGCIFYNFHKLTGEEIGNGEMNILSEVLNENNSIKSLDLSSNIILPKFNSSRSARLLIFSLVNSA